MDIVTLPVTGINQAIQENFLRELSHRVNIKGYAVGKQIQILIFKPAGRPQDEFDNIIQLFKETGRRLDNNLIFITATKPDRCKFEVPANFNFALQTCVFINDENEIDPMSSGAMDEVADLLTRKYGLQAYTHENRSHGAVVEAAVFQTAPETNVEEQRRESNALKQENRELKLHVEQKEQEGLAHQVEVKYLKENVEELKQDNKRLKEDVEKKEEERHDHQQKLEDLEQRLEKKEKEAQDHQQKLEDLEQRLEELKQENKRLKENVEKKEEGHDHQGKFKDLEQRLEEKGKKVYGHQMERKRKRLCLKEHGQGGRMPEIRFKHEKKSLLPKYFSPGEQMFSVNVHAVEEELTRIEQGHYDFQRKYEDKFHLEPGRLRRVLEYIEDVLKNISGDNLILDGKRFQNLTREMEKTFVLPADRFLEFLVQIHERNVHAK